MQHSAIFYIIIIGMLAWEGPPLVGGGGMGGAEESGGGARVGGILPTPLSLAGSLPHLALSASLEDGQWDSLPS